MKEGIEQQIEEYAELINTTGSRSSKELISQLDEFTDNMDIDRLKILGLYYNCLFQIRGRGIDRFIFIPTVVTQTSKRKVPGKEEYDSEVTYDKIEFSYKYIVNLSGYETLLSDIDSGAFEDTVKNLPDKVLIQRYGIEDY